MFDTDKLISCVHDKEAIWDQSSKEYSNKINREKAWIEIGQIMYNDWANLEKKCQEEKGKSTNLFSDIIKITNIGTIG